MKRTVGCFDPSIKNSYSVRVYIIAVQSLISVESLSSACVNSLQFAEIRFILFVPLCDCNNSDAKIGGVAHSIEWVIWIWNRI